MGVYIFKDKISRKKLQEIANERFGDMVKAAVDIRQEILALGPEMHIDAETELIEKEGAQHADVWGINLYPAKTGEEFLEFDSMINLKPAFGNRTRGVDDENTRKRIAEIINRLIID